MNSSPVLLSVHSLEIGYGLTPILPPISFDLRRGEVSSIVGHNGSGKSTLLKTLLGLSPKVGGAIHVFPETRIGYVPQRDAMDPIYPIQAQEIVEAGRYGIRGLGRRLIREDRDKVCSAMKATGVQQLAKRLFRTLSGGEQQRILIARAYCAEPSILILDEPTASMDETGAIEIMDMTLELAKLQGAAVLMVNHFIDLVAKISDQVILLDKERKLIQVGSPREILSHRGRK